MSELARSGGEAERATEGQPSAHNAAPAAPVACLNCGRADMVSKRRDLATCGACGNVWRWLTVRRMTA